MPPLPPKPHLPNLIDDSAKMYIDVLLQKSHETRTSRNYTIFNISIVVVFVAIFGGFLYYRYVTKKPIPKDNYKLIQEQDFILSKIRWFNEQKERIDRAATSPITGLPTVQSDEDMGIMPYMQ